MASECDRADVAQKRADWRAGRQLAIQASPGRVVFLDETSVGTRMVRARGRARDGARLKGAAPFGHWISQTFIAGLRCDGLVAPWVIEGAMDRRAFEVWVERELAPTLRPGDVVILDNLAVHKSARAARTIQACGAWILFLPPYSPDLNPIEMAFSKLKALLRKAAARTFDDLFKALGDICDQFRPEECWNFFKAAGYVA